MADQIEELVELGANPEEVFVHEDGVVMTPLAGAVWTQNDDAVYYLINNCKVNPNNMPAQEGTASECDVTPLMSAAWNGDFDIVNTLVGLGKADTETRDQCGMTALHHASQNGTLPSTQILLSLGANPNAVSKQNVTPLTTAVESGNIEVVLSLLSHGADPNIEDAVSGFLFFQASTTSLTILFVVGQQGKETSFTRALRRCRHIDGVIDGFIRAGADVPRGLAFARANNFTDIVPVLEKVVKDRCKAQFGSFLLGTHSRLGQDSSVPLLVSDTLSEILRHVLEVNHVTNAQYKRTSCGSTRKRGRDAPQEQA